MKVVLPVLALAVHGWIAPDRASDATNEEQWECMMNDECLITFLAKQRRKHDEEVERETRLRDQWLSEQYLKKQLRNPFGRRNPTGGSPFGNRDDLSNFRGPPIPPGGPPIPTAVKPSSNGENRLPRFVSPLAIDVRIGEDVSVQLEVVDDDGDPISYRITETQRGLISEKGVFTYSTTENDLQHPLSAIEELNVMMFYFTDGKGEEQQHQPVFNVCGCEKDSLCNYDLVKTNLNKYMALSTCICVNQAYTGRFCNEDKNACEDDDENECFPGTECIDNPAPMPGYMCGECPPGYEGDGKICELIDNKELTCLELPRVTNGKLIDIDDTDVLGVYSGQQITYECNPGYGMIGTASITCQSDGEFSDNAPICRDLNECLDNPCHPTASCRNIHGSFECYCDNDSQKNYNGEVEEHEKECNPVVAFVHGLSQCNAQGSDKVILNWSVGKWDNDPDVIDRYVVYWFPYDDEKAKADKIFQIQQWNKPSNGGRYEDYTDVMVDENKKDDDFMYAVYNFNRTSVTITDLEPNTNYSVTVVVEVKNGTTLDNSIFCKILTPPGIPTPPRSINRKEVTGTSVTLSFLAPVKPQGVIENYFIEHTIADESLCSNGRLLREQKKICMPRYTIHSAFDTQNLGGVPGLVEALIADLEPQEKYSFRVKALTKSTEGEWTNPIPVTTSSRLLPTEPRSSFEKVHEECIDVKLALIEEDGMPVQWDEQFRDIGSTRARAWNQKFAAALPEMHFISDNLVCFVEVDRVKYTEFNDQVIMESRLFILSSQGRKISNSQIKTYVHKIFEQIKIFADPEFANRVTTCDTCEGNECHQHAKCVARREDYLCMCKPGYRDVGVLMGIDPGYQCEATDRISFPTPPAQKKKPSKMCARTKADIYFLLDLSKTVTESNLETTVGMIRNMIRLFSYGQDGVKVAIGTFALTFGEVFSFSEYDTRYQILSDTLNMDLEGRGSGTRMGHAVNSMIQYINRPGSGRRQDVPLHVVVVTDGNSFDEMDEPGGRLKNMAQSIQVIAIGDRIKPESFLPVVHRPEDIIPISSYDDLFAKNQDYTAKDNIYHEQILDSICPSDACPGFAPQDIILVVENSAQMADIFSYVKNGLKSFVNDLKIQEKVGPGVQQAKIAIITYAEEAEIVFDFDDVRNSKWLRNQIDSRLLRSQSAETNLAAGLMRVKELQKNLRVLDTETFNWANPSNIPLDPFSPNTATTRVSAKVVILTTGVDSDEFVTANPIAEELKESNIDIAVIELSNTRNPVTSTISSSPEVSVHIGKTEGDKRLGDDIHNAFSSMKHNFFHGGCNNELRSPSWVHVIDNAETELSLAWEPLVGVDGYDLVIADSAAPPGLANDPFAPADLARKLHVPGDQNRETIDGLQPGKQWNVEIYSVQNEGDEKLVSADSVSETAWTRPVQPVVDVLEIGEYLAEVEVNVPAETGDVTDIRVYLREDSNDPEQSNNIVQSAVLTPAELNSMGNIITFDHIEPNKTYEITVESSSGPILSDPTRTEFKTRSLEPPQNIYVMSADAEGIQFGWDYDPTISKVIITVLSLDDDGGTENSVYEDSASSTTNHTISSKWLTPGTDYKIFMVTHNQHGQESAPSETIMFTTVSQPIFQLDQDYQSDDKITVSFNPPIEGGADFFRLELYTANEERLVHTIDVDFRPGERQYIETFQAPQAKLKPGSDYVIVATAISCPGQCAEGTSIYPSAQLKRVVVTDSDLEAPSEVTIISTSTETIKLAWGAVNNADEYRVLVFKADQPNQVQITDRRTVSFTESEGEIESLEPGVKYNMLVMGVRNGDAGKPIQATAWTNPSVVSDIVVDSYTKGKDHFADVRFAFDSHYKSFRVHLFDSTDPESQSLLDTKEVDRATSTLSIDRQAPRFLASFKNLLPATEYALQIETLIGDKSSRSPFATFSTKDAIPPQQVVIIDQTTQSITVQYNESADADSYDISVLDAETSRFVTSRRTTDLSYEFSNLTPGTNYKVAVASVSKGKRGIPSEEVNAWTLPGLIKNPNIQFGHTHIQVTFEHAAGGVDYYDIVVESMDSVGSTVDMRQIGPTEYPGALLKSEFFYPSRQYKVKVTTRRNQYKNTYEKIGTMKTHKPIILSAAVGDDGAMEATWRMDEDAYTDPITYDWRVIDTFSGDESFNAKGTTKEATRISAFDRTRIYKFEIRAKLRNVWSPWFSQDIALPSVETTQKPETILPTRTPGITEDKPVEISPQPTAAALINTPSGVCKDVNRPVDMIFVVDSSNSVGRENFKLMKQWLREIVHELKIGPQATHVALSLFNNLYNVIFDLREHDNNKDMISKINGMVYKGRGTKIERALMKTDSEQLQQRLLRKDADIYLYLITDGREKNDAEKTANEIRAKHPRIKIVSIGITDGIEYSELVKIASKPRKNHFFQLNTYNDLINHDRLQNLVLYHAGCDVEPPINTDDGSSRYEKDNINKTLKPPSEKDQQIYGQVNPKRGSNKEESGEITMNFVKQRGSGARSRVQLHLDQVEPNTKNIVDTIVVDIEDEQERKHTFTDLPLGYEYWGKARTYVDKPKGQREYSEFQEYTDIVHLKPENLKLESEQHKTDEIVLRFEKPAGHIDQVRVTTTTRKGNKQDEKVRFFEFGSDNFKLTEDGQFAELRMGNEDKIQPAGTYDIEVATVAGNKEGDELEIENLKLPEMGSSTFRITEVKAHNVVLTVTLPAGADGADIDVFVYGKGTPVGKIEDLGDGRYNITELPSTTRFIGQTRAYRMMASGERYYAPQPFENGFWTRPADVDCSKLSITTTSSKISIEWPRDKGMDLPTARYPYSLEQSTLTPTNEVAWNEVEEGSTRSNSLTLYNADGRANIKPNTTYRFKISSLNIGTKSYSTCDQVLQTKPLPNLEKFELGQKDGVIEANWTEVEGVEKYDIKVFGLSNDEYSLAKLLSKEELKMFDTSDIDAFTMEESNGAKSSIVLGSNTPVAPGKPYLVQINPTAAEEIGPASFAVTVIPPATPAVQASPTSKGLKIFINPGEGISEEFETVVFDQDDQVIARESITLDQRDSDGVIRQMIDAPVVTGSQVRVSVVAKSLDKVSSPAEEVVLIQPPPKEEIGVVLVTKTGVDIEWPAGEAVRFKLEVKDSNGVLISEPVQLTETEYLVQNLLHSKTYELAIEGFDKNGIVISEYGTTITTEPLEIKDVKIEQTTTSKSASEVTLSWTPDEQAAEYGIVLTSEPNNRMSVPKIPADQSTISIELLKPGTEYALEMTPYDSQGRPGLVATQEFMTKPGNPTGLEVQNDPSAEFITIRFTGVREQADYYDINIFPGEANYENPAEQLFEETIKSSLNSNQYTLDIEKSDLLYDVDYQVLIYSVLTTADGELLRSSPQRQLFNLPPPVEITPPSATPLVIQETSAPFMDLDFDFTTPMFIPLATTGLPDFNFETTPPPIDAEFATTAPFTEGFFETTPFRSCPATDIVLLVQNSKSVDWGKFTDFMRDLADRLILRDTASRLAILSYSRTANEHISFTDYGNKLGLYDRIDDVEKGGRNNAGGHLVDKGVKYISDDMFQDVRFGDSLDERKLRSGGNIVILVLLSSSSRSDPIEIQQTIASLDRRISSVRSGRLQDTVAELHVIHSNKVSNSQLNAFMGTTSSLSTKLHNIGEIENDGLRRFQFDREIFEPIGVCLTLRTTTPTPEPALLTTFPNILSTEAVPTTDYIADLETSTAMLSALATIITDAPESMDIFEIPPPPPPMFPPMAPPHIQRIIVNKESSTIATTEAVFTEVEIETTQPTFAPIQPVTSTEQTRVTPTNPPTTKPRKRRMPPPPPPPMPPAPPPPPEKINFDVVRTTKAPTTAQAGVTTKKPKRFLPPPPPPPPPPPVPPAALIEDPLVTTPEPTFPTTPNVSTEPDGTTAVLTTPQPTTKGTEQPTTMLVAEQSTAYIPLTTRPDSIEITTNKYNVTTNLPFLPDQTTTMAEVPIFTTTPTGTTEVKTTVFETVPEITSQPMIPDVTVLGLVEAPTSLYKNGTTAAEVLAVKDILTDKQSEAYKDVESDFVSKLDSAMSTFYPSATYDLSFVDFQKDNNGTGQLVAHFTLDIQETESLDLVERDLEGEIGLVDQSNDLINLGHNPKSLELSNDIGREFGMRVVYKDSRQSVEPVLDLYLSKIDEVITSETIAGNMTPVATTELLVNDDGSPRQSPPSRLLEYGDDTKELLFKITGTPGIPSTPYELGLVLGAQKVKNSLNVKISENDYRAQVVEVFPLGLLDIEEMEDSFQIQPGEEEQYTGTFVAAGLDPEDVFKLYESNESPNVKGNSFKNMIIEQGLTSDKITKVREIYFEPTDDDTVKVHFGIDADDGVTAQGLQDSMLTEEDTIELVDRDNNVVGRLSDLELSSNRRFEVEVTTDLPPGQIISRLENEPNAPEFEKVENVRSDPDTGKTLFDFVTDRNLNIVPANFPVLEEKIDTILGSNDAKIRIPGGEKVPLRQYTGTVEITADEGDIEPALKDWKAPLPLVQELNLPPQWVIDYKAAVELNVLEVYVAANISYGSRRSDIVDEVTELLDEGMMFNLNTARAFRGTCSMIDPIEAQQLNQTIHDLVTGIDPDLKTSAIYKGLEEIYAITSVPERRRRQAEEDELEVKFYFQSLTPKRLLPRTLQDQGRKIISQNPTFGTLYDSSTLIITPQMFEEDIKPPTFSTEEPTTVEPNTTLGPTIETVTTTIGVVTQDPNQGSASVTPPTLPPTFTKPAVSVFNVPDADEDFEPSDEDLSTLENAIKENCEKVEDVDCGNHGRRGDSHVVQCKYNVKANVGTAIKEIETSLEECRPTQVETDSGVNFEHDQTYIDENVDKCIDAYENDCETESSVCETEDGSAVFCKCKEGFQKEDENDKNSACVPKGPDVILIILIVLIIVLFLVILLLSYFVHQKRTKTGLYSPSKHQPTQMQS